MLKEQFAEQIRIGLLLRIEVTEEVVHLFRAAVEQIAEDELGVGTDFLHYFWLYERVIGFEPSKCVGIVHNVGDTDEVADILLDACKVAIFLLVVTKRHLDEGLDVGVAFVVAGMLKISVRELCLLVVRVLGVFAFDAKHSRAIITDEHDVHVGRAIDWAPFGGLGEDGELYFEIDFVVGCAVERERVLRTDPMEEIVRKHGR